MKTSSVIREIYLPMILIEKEPKDFYQQGYMRGTVYTAKLICQAED